jgi:S-DNA-T family DNA segregation ATPase FtsK/SpoIIIE
MSVIDRSLDSLTFLTDSARDALRRRLRELTGLTLIVTAMLLAVSFATWSVQDPSLSHATNTSVRNLLGIGGATVADLLMQLFGIASLAILLPIAVWGWRLASHRDLFRERWRLLSWIAGVALAAGFAASLPRTPSWPLPRDRDACRLLRAYAYDDKRGRRACGVGRARLCGRHRWAWSSAADRSQG